MSMDDEGSVLPLVALWLLALALMAMMLVVGGDLIIDRSRAQAAADAAALAGAAEGRVAAESVAGGNGAQLVDYRERSGRSPGSLVVVDVVVRFDDAMAAATARALHRRPSRLRCWS